jgi:hypothetical protein
MVKEGLKRLNSERKNFEALQSQLSNMLLGETEKIPIEEQVEEKIPIEEQAEEEKEEEIPSPGNESVDTSLPEPPESSGESPVVVYVKNAENQDP